jgi:transcriptional regulator with XRE-family HTH domain
VSAREELASLLLPRRIKAVRARAELTQEAFAAAIGTDRPRVNTWERGRGGISDDYAEKIAAFASKIYKEEIPSALFVSPHRIPLEEEAAQLVQAAAALERAGDRLAEIAERTVPLLERQEAVVAEMLDVLSELRRIRASS